MENIVSGLARFFIRRNYRLKLCLIQKYTKNGKILDIGCGDGNFLRYLPADWERYGVEPYANTLQDSSINFCNKQLEECSFQNEYFDVVTMNHSFEHIKNSEGTLKEIYSVLKQDGILIISVPNANSLGFKIFKKNWFHFDHPKHVHHFSPSDLQQLSKQSGFKTIKIYYPSIEFPLDLLHSLVNGFKILKPLPVQILILFPTILAKIVSSWFHASETFWVIFRKN